MDLSVVIPAYNEEDGIEKAIMQTAGILAAANIKSEIIVVNDGSTDNTKKVCTNLKTKENFIFIDQQKNEGYTETIKKGIASASGEYICYLDADLQYSPTDMLAMYKFAKSNNYALVMGDPPTKNYSFFKRVRSFVYNNLFIYFLFRMKTKDVNSLKMMKREILNTFKIEHGSWMIDFELVFRFKQKGHHSHKYPIRVYQREVGESKVTIWNCALMVFEVLKFRVVTLLGK